MPRVKKITKKSGLSIDVYNTDGKLKESLPLPKEMFDLKVSAALLSQYVRVYLANQRQGTQSTKTRSEVIGTTAKIYRQKGTGRARHGAKKAPIFVGGGLTHAPKPRDYRLKINKKQRRIALYNGLTLRNKKRDILVIDGLAKLGEKTQAFVDTFEKNNINLNKKNLFVYSKDGQGKLQMAARNIDNLTTAEVSNLNAYSLLANQKIIFSKEAIDYLISSKSNNNKK